MNYVFEREKVICYREPGVGKSTFDCLSGIETLYSGTISINFEDGKVAEATALRHLRISLSRSLPLCMRVPFLIIFYWAGLAILLTNDTTFAQR